MGNIYWSDIYKMSIADREMIVQYIKLDHENHQMMINSCSFIVMDSRDNGTVTDGMLSSIDSFLIHFIR